MKRFLATMGGVGYLPASGTFASLLTCLMLWPLLAWAQPSMGLEAAICLGGMILFSALNLAVASWAIAAFGDKDPGKFVLDEAAGICLTLLLVPVFPGWRGAALTLLVAFVAFRIFDITKPLPARQLEHLPGGWGILMDDLAAAVYANIICQLVLRWMISAV